MKISRSDSMGLGHAIFLKGYEILYSYFSNFMDKDDIVLDLGCGNGYNSHILKNRVKKVIGIDVIDYRKMKDFEFIKYDGKKIPLPSDKFSKTIIVFVLHHSYNPESILEEAKRVTDGHIILLEEYYDNKFDLGILKFFDSLFNLPHGMAMPYNFKTRDEWDEIFKKLNLEKVHEMSMILWPVPTKRVVYVLKTGSSKKE